MVSSPRDLSPSLTVSVIWEGRAAKLEEAEPGVGSPGFFEPRSSLEAQAPPRPHLSSLGAFSRGFGFSASPLSHTPHWAPDPNANRSG